MPYLCGAWRFANAYIRFTKEVTVQPETPSIDIPGIETPSITESVYYNFTDICMTEISDVGDICSDANAKVRAVKDESDEACTELGYTKTNQYVFLELPEEVDLSQYELIRIKANVPEQLCLRVFSEDLDTNTENWWSKYCLYDAYPFYGGTNGQMYEDLEIETIDSKTAKYIALVSNREPDNGYEMESYLIYSITLVSKCSGVKEIVIRNA